MPQQGCNCLFNHLLYENIPVNNRNKQLAEGTTRRPYTAPWDLGNLAKKQIKRPHSYSLFKHVRAPVCKISESNFPVVHPEPASTLP